MCIRQTSHRTSAWTEQFTLPHARPHTHIHTHRDYYQDKDTVWWGLVPAEHSVGFYTHLSWLWLSVVDIRYYFVVRRLTKYWYRCMSHGFHCSTNHPFPILKKHQNTFELVIALFSALYRKSVKTISNHVRITRNCYSPGSFRSPPHTSKTPSVINGHAWTFVL